MVKKKIIRVKSSAVEMLIAKHGTTKATVYNALSYRSNSEQAKLIRHQALKEFGGIEESKTIF